LLEDAVLEERRRQILVVDGNRNSKFGSTRMKQARMASSLVVDVKTGAKKYRDNLFGFENWKLGRHAPSGLWNGDRHPLRRDFGDVAGNRFTGHQNAFEVASNCVSRHFASVLQGLTVGTDLRDGGNKDIESAFRHRFEKRCITVFSHGSLTAIVPRESCSLVAASSQV